MCTYNGWKNWETWNIALWIKNYEGLYNCACDFMRKYNGRKPYKDFIIEYCMDDDETPDGAQFINRKLAYAQLNSMMRELID